MAHKESMADRVYQKLVASGKSENHEGMRFIGRAYEAIHEAGTLTEEELEAALDLFIRDYGEWRVVQA